ncbi:MAG: CDP-diacylglycerol--glycerol-3-phosphate 3-phosphatidyltransferase [Lachnospiraceae bacterium]|nr:CDP-diacylglycerol--glycerol-3-phosphate 3-phosphatidyltransferase [Lachnospiraceae bacterium]
MNLPNKITVARFFLVPVFAVIILLPYDWAKIAALVVFLIACLSDFFDGYLARKKNMVTDFGKLMDPLADKLLVCTALICFVKERDNFPAWCAILIIAREFIISGIRQIAAEKKQIIMASIWGKIKTVTQMILCVLFILDLDNDYSYLAQNLFVWIASFFTVLSLVDYIIKNFDIFRKATK